MKPGICLVLDGPTLQDCRDALESQRAWIDLAELRADLIDRSEWPFLEQFSRDAPVPLILTLRQPADGGKWQGTATERAWFFEQALQGSWTWVDIEASDRLPAFEARWIATGRELIVSFHEFHGLGEGGGDLLGGRIQALENPGVVVKAAVFPQSSAEFLAFTRQVLSLPPGNRVLLAMGGFGASSRILASRLDSRWTYASSPGKAVAPGQLDPQTLVDLYRFHEQTPQTPVYGVVGNPVFHSKSPQIHNPGLATLGLPGTYVTFLADDPAFFLQTAELLGVTGLSCTIPFKQAFFPFLEELTPAVKAIGAANTLIRTETGWRGENTDAAGVLEPLDELLAGAGPSEERGRAATVIGTGGAARAVAWVLKKAGWNVLVVGRDRSKADALATELGVSAAWLHPSSLAAIRQHADVLVQTTNVGMGEQEGLDPMPWFPFDGSEIAYEIVYAPAFTPWLSRARAAGCRLLFGKQMLEHQGWHQFKHFTGHEYPPITKA